MVLNVFHVWRGICQQIVQCQGGKMSWVEGFHRLNNPDTLNESFLTMYVHLASRAQDGKAKYTAVKQKENCKPLADVVCKDTAWRAPVRKEHFLKHKRVSEIGKDIELVGNALCPRSAAPHHQQLQHCRALRKAFTLQHKLINLGQCILHSGSFSWRKPTTSECTHDFRHAMETYVLATPWNTRAARQQQAHAQLFKDWRSPPRTPKDIRLLEKTSDTTFEHFWKDMQPSVEKKQ